MACLDGLFGARYHDLLHELLAIGDDRDPGIFAGFNYNDERSRDGIGGLALPIRLRARQTGGVSSLNVSHRAVRLLTPPVWRARKRMGNANPPMPSRDRSSL